MKLVCLLFTLLLSVAALTGQGLRLEANVENFNRAMKIERPSVDQVDTVIQLGVAYSYLNKDTSLLLGERSVALGEAQSDPLIYAKALLEFGDSYRVFKDLGKAEELVKRAREIYLENNAESEVASTNNVLGAIEKNRGDNEGAINFYLKALEVWERLGDTQNMIKPIINIGAVFQSSGRPLKALEYDVRAWEIAEIIGDDRAKSYVSNNMAIIYNDLALRYQDMLDTAVYNVETYKDSASYFIDRGLEAYQRGLDLSRKNKDEENSMRILGNMVDLKITAGDYEGALDLCSRIEKESIALGNMRTLNSLRIRQAKVSRHFGQIEKAKRYAQEALNMASKEDMASDKAQADFELYLLNKDLGNVSTALAHFEAYQEYMSINGKIERNQAIAEVESRYQNAQKEKRILQQENDILELRAKNDKISKQRHRIIGGSLMLAILGFLGVYIGRIRKERNDKIAFAEALIFAQEEERKRIARDLHDGVGQSLLLIKKQMANTREKTEENQQLISQTLEEVRSISRDLHPFQLKQFGLTATISDTIEKVAQSSDLFISHDIDNIDHLLTSKAEIHVYRVVQEALSNIVKHAEASAARVVVKSLTDRVEILIQDNGKGFSHADKLETSKSLGIRTMFERISAIGGELKIGPGKSNGTEISILISKTK